MLLLDLSHTSHTRARTGIQRVCRALAAESARRQAVLPVCFDPHQHGWRALRSAERATLADAGGVGTTRGARWTLAQKVLGRAKRLAGRRLVAPAGAALICPELFSAKVGQHLPELFAAVRGPRVALFHDAIGLKFPEFTPPATVARLPVYLRELARFDGVAAVSEDSAATLRQFWQWAGLASPPPVVAIPLGLDPLPVTPPAPPAAARPRVLCVSTLEARKNHLALLEAAEALWRDGIDFELELIGLPRADTGTAALEKIRQLREAGRPLVYHGAVSEEHLHAAYARATFTIYPSHYEGFGLPVLESLQHGRPCVSSSRGALAEIAPGGGVELLVGLDAASLAASLRDLLAHPAEIDALAVAARSRKFRSWSDYVHDLHSWMQTLPRRD